MPPQPGHHTSIPADVFAYNIAPYCNIREWIQIMLTSRATYNVMSAAVVKLSDADLAPNLMSSRIKLPSLRCVKIIGRYMPKMLSQIIKSARDLKLLDVMHGIATHDSPSYSLHSHDHLRETLEELHTNSTVTDWVYGWSSLRTLVIGECQHRSVRVDECPALRTVIIHYNPRSLGLGVDLSPAQAKTVTRICVLFNEEELLSGRGSLTGREARTQLYRSDMIDMGISTAMYFCKVYQIQGLESLCFIGGGTNKVLRVLRYSRGRVEVIDPDN